MVALGLFESDTDGWSHMDSRFHGIGPKGRFATSSRRRPQVPYKSPSAAATSSSLEDEEPKREGCTAKRAPGGGCQVPLTKQ